MKIKTTHVLIGIVAITFLANGDRVANQVESGAVERDERAALSEQIKEAREKAREQKRWSAVALERAKSGCTAVVDSQTKEETVFTEGETVVISSNPGETRVLDDGQCVYNSDGWTAEMLNGAMVKIAKVAPEDKAEFMTYFLNRNEGDT